MQALDTLFKVRCNYGVHNSNCLLIAEKIRSMYEKDGTIDPNIFTRYLSHLSNSLWAKCHTLSEHRVLITEMTKTIIPSEMDIRTILSFYNSHYGYGHVSSDKEELYKILQDLIDRKLMTPTLIKYSCDSFMKDVSEFLFTNTPADTKLIELACSYGYVNSLPVMLGQKIKATTKALENLLYYLSQTNQEINKMGSVNLLLKYGAEPDLICLNKACLLRDKDILIKILSYKIKPTKECFNQLITPLPSSYSRNARRAKILQTEKNNHQTKVAELIDILIAHGYTLTKEDITDALENEYYINSIQRFNFKLDEKFIEKCYQKNYFPYKDLNLKPNIQCLRDACKIKANLKNIKELVKQGLEPDIECLRNACGFRSGNVPVVRYLVEVKKLKPDIECIKQISRTINNGTLDYLFKQYDSTYAQTDDDSNDKSDNESDNDDKVTTQLVEVDDLESESEDDEPVKKTVNTKQISEENELDSEYDKPVKRVVKAKPEPISDDDSISDEEQMEDEDGQIYSVIDYKKKGYNVVDIKKMDKKINGRIKQTLTDDAYKLLDIKPGTQMIFSNVRDKLKKYIKDNNLVDKDMKNLIKPDETLRKLLNIKADEYINTDDDDRIVSLLIKEKN